MQAHSIGLAPIALVCVSFLSAQSVDDTRLKQVIILGRHSVRAPYDANSTLDHFAAQPFPRFSVSPGALTPNGAKLETILGGYYRLWLTNEGLLTGNDSYDSALVYFQAKAMQRTIDSAQAFASGLLPSAKAKINSGDPQDCDPLFDPVDAGVASLDYQKAAAAVMGRLGGSPQSLASAFAPELALTRSVLFNYPLGQTPIPEAPKGVVDVTAIPFNVAAGEPGLPVYVAGLTNVVDTIDPFVMEYADGMPQSEVGWGRLTAGGIGQISRLLTLLLDLSYRTPYLDTVQTSNLASHVLRSMVQASSGNALTGALGSPSTKVIVLVASDNNLSGLAGLFHLDWLVPGYQPDYCAPGGALVFELRQSRSTGEYIVRTSYLSQTLDQLRNQTLLTLDAPPASAPVFIPGCSVDNDNFDCPLAAFVGIANQVIDSHSADLQH
jgi:4-phytase/acid phosphatase